jgi:hypothetical protein
MSEGVAVNDEQRSRIRRFAPGSRSRSRSVTIRQLNPERRMVAGIRLTSDSAVHASSLKSVGGSRAQQQMVDPQTGVSLPSIPQVVPERVHRLARVQSPDRVHPSLFRQLSKGCPARGLNESVLVPRLRGVDVLLSRNDIVVPCEHDGHSCGQKLGRVGRQSAKPSELVIEFGTRLRIPVGRVERRNHDPIHCRFDVPALRVAEVAGKLAQGLDRLPSR